MGSYPTGVTIVTTADPQGEPVGLTVNSFTSVSIDPLLVLWCLDHRSGSFQAFQRSQGFAVHVLAAEQEAACWAFAGKETDRFSKIDWRWSEHQLPLISGSFGLLQCKTVQKVEAGDHTIFIGEVVDLDRDEKKDPMLYYRRNVGAIPPDWKA
jgi:flavin reductase (DIM6/NTAB) family NADH-FMN oxidoreductase RutF